MTELTCDVAVVGAGTAGLAAEHEARKAGASTLLIDPRFAGTTCATVGCMPSKLLIAAADAQMYFAKSQGKNRIHYKVVSESEDLYRNWPRVTSTGR